jgi:uncharacterized protein YqcC (DUF446 family)
MDAYKRSAYYAGRIERELRGLNGWQDASLPDTAYTSETAFFADTMTFYQWLQFVLLPRVREIIDQRGSFPAESYVAAYAVRELDGVPGANALVHTLSEFDDFIEGLHRSGKRQA